MLQCYFDASDKGESDISCVAGYIAHVDDWSPVEKAWSDALLDYGLASFHQRTLRKDLSRDQGQDLERRLTAIIQQSSLGAVGAALVNHHWREPDWGYIQTERLNTLYEQCMDMALDVALRFARDRFKGEKLQIFCDKDEPERKIWPIYYRSDEKFKDVIPSSFAIGSSQDYLGLQVADFGAWRLRKSWVDIGFEGGRDPWGSMPKGSGGASTSFWSLKPHATVLRSIALRSQQSSDE